MNHRCCFLGHRKIKITESLENRLQSTLKTLILNENVDTFLFGSKSQFNDLCHMIVTKLQADFPHIKRIYIRAEFPHIDSHYHAYLLQNYEDTYYPGHMVNAGKAVYVERNFEMIKQSRFCIAYYDKDYAPTKRKKTDVIDHESKSGTKIAYDYALKKHKIVINMFDETVKTSA